MITPKQRRGPWSSQEDHHLLHLVNTQGAHNWVRISQLIQSRSPKQCRERYHQNLKPSLNLEPISAEEGALIEQLVEEMGKRWAEIARRLHGRSDNAVKNWWNGGMNRRRRLDHRGTDTRTPKHLTLSNTSTHKALERPPFRRYDAISHQSQYFDQKQLCGTQSEHDLDRQRKPSFGTISYPSSRMASSFQVSPTTNSSVLTTDSTEVSTPSLVSDASNTSYSRSPHTTPQFTRLPPLVGQFGENKTSSTTSVPLGPYGEPSLIHQGPQNNERAQDGLCSLPVPPSSSRTQLRGQLPLPDFRTATAPETRHQPMHVSKPSSPPPKDTRMHLSSLLS